MNDLLISQDDGVYTDGFVNRIFGAGKKQEDSTEDTSFKSASEELLTKNKEPKSALEKALHDLQFQGKNEMEFKSRQVELVKRIDQLEAQIFPN